MISILRDLFKGDRVIWGVYALLVVISILEMYSASSTLAYGMSTYYKPISRHVSMLLSGTIVALIFSNIPHKFFAFLGRMSYIVSILLLFAVQFKEGTNDAARWIFGVQPSEFAKFGLVILVSLLLCKGQIEEGVSNKNFKIIIGITIAACILILPENFSTALLLGTVVYFMMFIGRVQLKKLALIALLAGAFLGVGYTYIKYAPPSMLIKRMDTWKNRLESDPVPLVDQSINDKNLQKQYARMAVVNGGLTGKFFGRSQIRDFLPQAYSDFIYAIIIEEMGLLGGLMIIIFYLVLMFRVLNRFRDCEDLFGGFMMLGLMILILFQALINMAVGVGLFPVTGQPLPLLSRGGSSMLITSGYFGIIQSVCHYVQTEKGKKLLAEKQLREEEESAALAAEAEYNIHQEILNDYNGSAEDEYIATSNVDNTTITQNTTGDEYDLISGRKSDFIVE